MIILNFLIQAIKIIVLLGILVIIHEGGHFTVAKLFHIPVKEFAVGFGKKIWSKTKGGTEYSIRIFPLGGFVDLGDEDREGAFGKAPLYKKNLILSAGVFVNFVFAIILAFFVLLSRGGFITNQVKEAYNVSNAYTAGIQAGDVITKVNGKKIRYKTELDLIMANNSGEVLNVEVNRNGETLNYTFEPYAVEYLTTGFSLEESTKVLKSQINEIKVNDEIQKVNGITVTNSDDIVNELFANMGEDVTKNIKLEILRDGEIIEKEVEVNKKNKYYVGISLEPAKDEIWTNMYYSFIGTKDFLAETFKELGKLITGKSKNAELMGIIGMSDIITKTSNASEYFAIMASVSLSLAIANLLPLPLLDGGKIVLYTIEKYRKKEFGEKFLNVLSVITIILLVALTIYVMIKDIIRLI